MDISYWSIQISIVVQIVKSPSYVEPPDVAYSTCQEPDVPDVWMVDVLIEESTVVVLVSPVVSLVSVTVTMPMF